MGKSEAISSRSRSQYIQDKVTKGVSDWQARKILQNIPNPGCFKGRLWTRNINITCKRARNAEDTQTWPLITTHAYTCMHPFPHIYKINVKMQNLRPLRSMESLYDTNAYQSLQSTNVDNVLTYQYLDPHIPCSPIVPSIQYAEEGPLEPRN